MELIIKQLKKGAKHTRMSVTEKSDMKNVLLRHMKSNPVSNEVLARRQKTKAHAILSPLQVNNLRNKKTMPILVILGLLMSGSASFAAETTVPGDILYPVKVHVNESVRGAVTVTPSAKAEWELHLVERRLEEVEKLATRPNAAPQAQEQAQENLVKYTKHVEDRIAKFEEDEDGEHALKTASDLSGVLAAYEALLAALATGQTTTSGTATSTPATTASSTATSTVSNATASSTPATTLTPASIAALREILSKLNQAQNGAEEKHNELKKKYNKEEKNDNDDEDGEDEGDHDDWTPAPVVPPVATTTPSTSTSTATTTPTTVATSTAVIASSTQRVRIEKHDDDNHREEIRTTSTSTTSTTTPRVSRERTESRESHNDND